MSADANDPLPPEAELALAYSGPPLRPILGTALQLDRRLARIVAHGREPMLAQMRLAWWRDAFAKPVGDRPRGDAVLDAIGTHWAGREAMLAEMVDGWEVLVTAERLGEEEAEAFGRLRGGFFAGFAAEPKGSAARRLAAAGQRWALADAAAGVSDPAERAALVAAGLALAGGGRLGGRDLGGLAVLDALARRALARGGRPLMEGRGAPLVAIRAAIFRV